MTNLFQPTAVEQILSRIQKLQSTSQAQWGKMNVSQMMAHCQQPFKAYFGEAKIKRGLMGILFGKIAKRQLFADKPWSKNLPTAPEFKITDTRDFEKEKQQLVQLIHRFTTEGKNVVQNHHPFFGSMTTEEWAVLNYRHLDHHLRQFGA